MPQETITRVTKDITIAKVLNGNFCSCFASSYPGKCIKAGKYIKGSPPETRTKKAMMYRQPGFRRYCSAL